ncbi:H+transporting two-sector ATPase B/B' subunit [Oleidesulfovibrio alaskensis G20]|jgi:F-type H+-transporting ATPase subunit b|uniref:ATP synthase subunit b n=1 Tax=Oleidesulfovibrio alaskensis (strain ATCC BAA-1058 / DSM 17464 / G20) TaxID=207559 RepID=Q313V5_OLEA2|nr:ATP synthase F0 subunit B [Oleidesulfovibrio alaskensis]ABB37791.1 H+transporting two-sector ATPase B/B' subunit [Oleidesulfovibrio alaskensis G20]MBG0773743.1 ATP synthase F0 subunit B [Oleidesulfovibrio alaskensis]MBL3582405.1 ATP synthase F0 subunit B [Oleidesulfovibrio alaskensis]
MINLDFTLLIQLVNFLVTLLVLNALLIRPIREIIKQRADKMSGLVGDTEGFLDAANQKLSNYETALSEARRNASAVRDAQKEQGLAREQELVTAASEEAQAILQASRKQVAKDVQEAMETLKGQVGALAEKATAKVLG